MRQHAHPPLASLCRAVVAVGLLVLAAAPVRGQPDGHPILRDFQLTGQYELRVKPPPPAEGDAAAGRDAAAQGEVVPEARIYHSEPAGAYLVVAPVFEFGVLILPRTTCVEKVGPDEMTTREDGGIDVKKDVSPCALGHFRVVGASVVFRVGDTEARLEPKPPLEGAHLRGDLLDHSPEYGRAAKAYQPDSDALGVLQRSKKKARVQVFFGSWCTFCNKFIPHILRVEEALAGTELSFEYFGLPPPPAAWVSEASTRMGVKRLPTGIVFIDDKEVGRVIGTEWIRPEKALLRYLR